LLLTAVRSGIDAPYLLARDAEGIARAIPAEVAWGPSSTELRRDVAVRVRLGGFTFVVAGVGATDIPRVLDAEQRLRFDAPALARSAETARYDTASVSFMSAVQAGPVLAAAFGVAPRTRPITLILP
jgi:hypothetical protein